MKKTFSTSLLGLGLFTIVAFTSCHKDEPGYEATRSRANLDRQSTASSSGFLGGAGDRIDEIVRDLSKDQYSFSFNEPKPEAGITRTSYGADSYLAYVDPQDLICPEPFRFRQKKVAIWKRPNFIWPTCPDMTIDIWKLEQVRTLAEKADPAAYGGLQTVKLLDGGGFLASEKFTGQFRNMQLDKFDGLTKDLDGAKYLMLNAPGDFSGGTTRSFYGYADLNGLVFNRVGATLKDILKPTLKGCFDPLVLSVIRERLQRLDPAAFKGLQVTPIGEHKDIAVLSY